MLRDDRQMELTPGRMAAGAGVLVAAIGLVLWVTDDGAIDAPEPDAAPSAQAMIEAAPAVVHRGVADAGGAAATADAAPPPRPPGEYGGVLQKDQTVTASLQAFGATPQHVHQIVQALRAVYDFRDARPGARFTLELDPKTQALRRFEFEHGPLDIYEVARDAEGNLVGRKVDVPVEVVEAEVGAEIKSSLYRAMQRVGESPALVALIVDVFAWDIDFFKDTQPGDRFRVVVEKIHKDGAFIRYGRILAAEYTGKVGTFRTFWFQPPGDEQGQYYLEDGRSARKTFLATPLKFVRVSSRFNKRRRHPVLGYTKAHNGVDYAAPTGTPVRAMADGKVIFAGRKGPNGNLIRIDHGGGLVSAYAHLHRIGPGIERGVHVRQKQVIGQVGSTGRSTGPHLHFGVKQGGRWIDPQSLKMRRAAPVPAKHKRAFEAVVARRVERLQALAVLAPTVDEPIEDEEGVE